jgi:hypothetical protein
MTGQSAAKPIRNGWKVQRLPLVTWKTPLLQKPYMLFGFSYKVSLQFKNKTKSSVLYAASLNLPFAEEDDKKARAQDK